MKQLIVLLTAEAQLDMLATLVAAECALLAIAACRCSRGGALTRGII